MPPTISHQRRGGLTSKANGLILRLERLPDDMPLAQLERIQHTTDQLVQRARARDAGPVAA